MDFKNVFIIVLILVVLFSISSISAEDINLNSTLESDNNQYCINEVSEIDSPTSLNLDSNDCENLPQGLEFNDENYIIYVGQNDENGNGSQENPYKNFDLACEGVKDGKNNVTINVYDGTYYLGSILNFNCSNIHIHGIGNNVIIKNQYDVKGTNKVDGSKQSFGLTSLTGTFLMSNIIVDASEWTQSNSISSNSKRTTYFYIFYNGLSSNEVIFENCTFVQYYSMLPQYMLNDNVLHNNKFLFKRCKFEGNITRTQYFGVCPNDVSFEYCIFNLINTLGKDLSSFSENYTISNSWFGQNSLPDYLFYHESGNIGDYIGMSINKHAIFHISEEKIDDATYEIIGKLMWNDSTTEGIENLGDMVVSLKSESGEILTNAVLENGTFKVIYTSIESNHKISATLDNEIQTIQFQNINFNLDVPCINYGDNQNITVTLPDDYNGVVYLTVNNKTYKKDVEFTKVVTVDISDVLPVGTYDVNVTFIDKIDNETCAIYGFNTTTITVAKVSNYDFDATITPTTVYLGDNANITLSLPSGATGNVSVKVGDNEAKTFNVNDVISIDGFVPGDNVVNITFSSDIYDAKSVVKTVVASPKPTTIATVNVTTIYNVAKGLVITLTDVNGKVLANKTVNVVVGTINNNLTTNASGQVSIDVSTLAPNTYVANIAFAGDDLYAKSNATANVVVNKIASSLTAPAVTATYNVGKNLVITLTANGKALANQKVTVKVGTISKTLTTDAKGQVSVDVSKLTPKTYTATFTYAGDDINTKSSNTAKVVVNKAKPKITAKKATFKAKKKTKKYSIVLKDNKGKAIKKAKVTLKVKGKTYKATTNAKGKATFKITKLTKKGKQTATIKFGGNTLYKAVSKKVKLTIKK